MKSIRYFDAIGWTEVTDSLGHVTRYQWLPTGQVIQRINPSGGIAKTEYDGAGRVSKSTGPAGDSTSYEYDGEGNRAKTVDALGNAWEYRFNADHLAVSVTDPAGNEWKREFENNRLKSLIDPLGGVWRYGHDPAGRILGMTDSTGARMEFQYAEDGSLDAITDRAGRTTRYRCDELGRVIWSMNPAGETVRKTFDIAGNLLSLDHPGGGRFTFTHDPKGRITSVTDGSGRRATKSYGPCGRLAQRQDAAGNITRYAWGSEPGRLLQVTLGDGPSYRFVYDALGKVVEEVGFDGRRTTYRRDVAGNCVGLTNGAGEEVDYSLDALGRVGRKTFPDGSAVEFAYDPLGRLSAAANPDIALAFERDALGRVVRETQGDAVLDYAYDAAGGLAEIRGPMGYRIAYGRDADGALQEAVIRDGWTIAFEDRGAGRAGRTLPGGAVLDFNFEAETRSIVQTFSPADGGSDGFTRAFRHAEDGSLLSVEDSRKGVTAYAYDEGGRISSVLREGGETDRYQYDASGNLIRNLGGRVRAGRPGVCGRGPSLQARTPTLQPTMRKAGSLRLKPGARKRRPARGHSAGTPSTSCGRWRPRQGNAGPMPTIPSAAASPRRARPGPKTMSGTGTSSSRASGTVAQAFAWYFPPEGFAPLGKESGGRFFAAIPDHLGTPVELIDEEGGIARSLEHGLFGERRRSEGGGPDSEWRFPGQWFDEETGLHYNRFRYYDPATGRYLSQDPLRLMGGKNLYVYGRDPLNWFDPFGLATLFRGMMRDSDGNPVVHSGETADGRNAANSLGVRPDETGMSTSLDPAEIQPHRRPPDFGGTQGRRNDPDSAGMFAIDTEVLAQHGLIFDNDHDGHVNITTAPGIDSGGAARAAERHAGSLGAGHPRGGGGPQGRGRGWGGRRRMRGVNPAGRERMIDSAKPGTGLGVQGARGGAARHRRCMVQDRAREAADSTISSWTCTRACKTRGGRGTRMSSAT